ncbi:MAG: hypothetical protein GXO19_06835 [Epsilonproteobacteria bacterium]|nr:hypothetical protein [Campylobacterota bacterium]NPA57431.1 hypothetical protein [Campylobacterota bacterium]
MRERLEYFLVKGLLFLSKLLPPSALYSLTSLLGRALFLLDRKRREIAIANIERGLQVDREKAEELARATYRQLSKSAAEFLLLATGRFDFDRIEGKELEKLKAYSPPVILITAHIGNWEALAHYIAQRWNPIAIVGRAGNNRLIEEFITTPLRNRFGNRLIHKHRAAKELIRALKGGENVGLLLDQRGGRDGIMVEFFGRPASTLPTAYTLQKRFKVPIVPTFLVREGERLVMKVFDPIQWEEGISEERHTEMINRVYERIIRSYPDQWFWMHERWRR